jgi:hypothetical protein
MIQLETMNNSAKPAVRNLHARLTAVESEIRSLKKGVNTSAAADALDQGDTDRARIRVRTGRLVLCIAREPSWLADGPKRGYGPEQPLALALSSCRHHSLRRGPPP